MTCLGRHRCHDSYGNGTHASALDMEDKIPWDYCTILLVARYIRLEDIK